MRLTNVLLKQHVGYHFKKHWHYQSKRKILDKGALKSLTSKGIPIFKPEDVLHQEKKPQLIKEIPDYIPQAVKLDKTHPDWHERVCYSYKDDSVLLEGLTQAKIITNTVEVQEGLPERISTKDVVGNINKQVRRIILNSHILDAEQKKLPKIIDPERPAWNFPRSYGVTDKRVNTLMINRLLQLVEINSDPDIVKERSVLHDLHFWHSFEKGEDLMQFRLRGDAVITSLKPLSPLTTVATDSLELPDIFPITYNVTLNIENIYKVKNIYPISSFIPKSHPHTIFVHYNNTEVKNLFEEEVTEEQILGRSLLKTFTAAAAYAKQKYGEKTGTLPSPVTLQCVHTDGRLFHFGMLQLNTLDVNDGKVKNVWYHMPRIPLFNSCFYDKGKPVLEGYNSEVVKHLMAFYNNV